MLFKRKEIEFIIMLLLISAGFSLKAQDKATVADTSRADSAVAKIPLSSNAVKSKVKYIASDSMRVDLKEEKIFLYGDADVTYEDVNLKAEFIEMSFKTNIISAKGQKDSSGTEFGMPVFTQGAQTFQSKEMTYNFQTKKGRISDVITKEGEGYLHGQVVKKDTSDNLYIKRGKYTTCDLPHPHFYIGATKLKVIKEDKIVTGPANLWIEDVPTPLAIPFGFFPNKKGRASGILLPQYGESQTLGFFLRDGGYYFGKNDYFDLALTGDIFSKGSYAVKVNSNYNKRYAFNGNIGLDYAVNRFPSETDYSEVDLQKNFFVKWRHVQDAKARPGSRFSADVNAGTSNYNKFNSNNSLDYLTNTFMSNINYSKTWRYATLSGGVSHNQNTQTKIININAPTLAFAVNSFNPVNIFRNNGGSIGNKWYDKLNLAYQTEMRNEISSPDSLLFEPYLDQRMRNGMRHTIPFRASLNVLKYINITPSVSYTELWYLKSYDKQFDFTDSQVKIKDTVEGFVRTGDVRMQANATTNYYGIYELRSGKIKAFRHKVTPSVGVSYLPEKINGVTRIYGQTGQLLDQYTIYDQGIYGRINTAEAGLLNFDLLNNLEMKYRSNKDTANPIKKLPLVEAYTISASYNFLADSMRWSDIVMRARTNIFQKIDVQLNALFNPYVQDTNGRNLNRTQWEVYGRVARLTTAGAIFNFNLNPAARRKPSTGTPPSANLQYVHLMEYVDWSIPWSLNVTYNINYSATNSRKDYRSLMYYQLITNNLSFSGDVNLTEKWKIGFRSGYEFRTNEFTYTTLNIYRDLHCWEMRINLVPFGERKMYSLEINVKSSTLRDLKLPMRRNWYDLR